MRETCALYPRRCSARVIPESGAPVRADDQQRELMSTAGQTNDVSEFDKRTEKKK